MSNQTHLGFSPGIELNERRAATDGRLRVHKGPALDDFTVLMNKK